MNMTCADVLLLLTRAGDGLREFLFQSNDFACSSGAWFCSGAKATLTAESSTRTRPESSVIVIVAEKQIGHGCLHPGAVVLGDG